MQALNHAGNPPWLEVVLGVETCVKGFIRAETHVPGPDRVHLHRADLGAGLTRRSSTGNTSS